jgi:hypothetical protein
MGVLKHLASFWRLLPVPCRASYLPLLEDILRATSPYNWRLRKTLASQLPELVLLPPPESVFGVLFPLTMQLLQDTVAEVRVGAYRGMARMLCRLAPDPGASGSGSDGAQYLVAIATAINALYQADSFQPRLVWAELARVLLQELPAALLEKFFLRGLLVLASDPVLAVRICVARALGGTAETGAGAVRSWSWLFDRLDFRECVQRLRRDDREVIASMSLLSPLFPGLEFEAISCRGLKGAPGGAIPVELLPNRDSGGSCGGEEEALSLNAIVSDNASADGEIRVVETVNKDPTNQILIEDSLKVVTDEIDSSNREYKDELNQQYNVLTDADLNNKPS